jgi:NOL1/NOP2/fmu family ribosome biogenesis protein
MLLKFIRSSVKKKILSSLSTQFGIQKLPYLLIKSGKEKIRAFSGSFSKDEIKTLSQLTNIELIGTYLIKEEHDLRLSIEGTLLLKSQITKNIIEINDSQLNNWIHGLDLDIKTSPSTKVIKHNQDFIGCGKSNSQKIFNYVPKDRRLKN